MGVLIQSEKISKYSQNVIISKTVLCLLLIIAGSSIIGLWTRFAEAPTPVKLMYAACSWGALVVFPYKLVLSRRKEFPAWAMFCLFFLLIQGFISISRTILSDDPILNYAGNKYISLFGNELTALIFVPPLYAYLSSAFIMKKVFIKVLFLFLYLSLGYIFIFKNGTPSLIVSWVTIFIPYVSKRIKIAIILTMVGAVFTGTQVGARASLICLALGLLAYFIVYVLRNKIILNIVCWTFILLPFTLIGVSLHNQRSIFEMIPEMLGQNDEMSVDTRTFLYIELYDDLKVKNSLATGKGAYSHYFSPYFFATEGGDHPDRMLSEVPILNFLLKGGLLYSVTYLVTLIGATCMALYKSKNLFLKAMALVLSGWIFNIFVSDLNGSSFLHIGLWMLIGCCLSKKWLNYTDEEIKEIFKQ